VGTFSGDCFPNFSYWHSATFNNAGTKLLFTDEWGGGAAAQVPRYGDDGEMSFESNVNASGEGSRR
jgi:hypothetical protein